MHSSIVTSAIPFVVEENVLDKADHDGDIVGVLVEAQELQRIVLVVWDWKITEHLWFLLASVNK